MTDDLQSIANAGGDKSQIKNGYPRALNYCQGRMLEDKCGNKAYNTAGKKLNAGKLYSIYLGREMVYKHYLNGKA